MIDIFDRSNDHHRKVKEDDEYIYLSVNEHSDAKSDHSIFPNEE